MEADRVAVLIAAKDASATIRRAVLSAQAQPRVSEIVVVDDGSSDDTAAVAASCGGGVIVERLPQNAGPSVARNRAIAISTAPIVCVLDADDYFLPGRIDNIFMNAGVEWDFASDGMLMLQDGALPETARQHDFRAMVGADWLSASTFVLGNISRPGRLRLELGFMKPLMRRAFLDSHGMRYDEALRLGEDYVLYAEALLRGARYRLTDGFGYVAVWRQSSLSGRHSAADLCALAAADGRLARVAPAEAAVLRQHARSVQRKADFRMALDLKQQGSVVALAGFLASHAASVPYMVRETLRARLRQG